MFINCSFSAQAAPLSCIQLLNINHSTQVGYENLINSIPLEVAKVEITNRTQLAKNMKAELAKRGWFRTASKMNARAAIHNTFFNYVDTQHGHIVLTPILDLIISRVVSTLSLEPHDSITVEKVLLNKLKKIEEHHAYYSVDGRYIIDFWDHTRVLTLLDSIDFLARSWSKLSSSESWLMPPLSRYNQMLTFFTSIGLRPWGEAADFGINLISTDAAEVARLSTSIGNIIYNMPSRLSNIEIESARVKAWSEYLHSYFKGRLADTYGMKSMFDQVVDRVEWLGILSKDELNMVKVELFNLNIGRSSGVGLQKSNPKSLKMALEGFHIITSYIVNAQLRVGKGVDQLLVRPDRIHDPAVLLKFLKDIGFKDSNKVVDHNTGYIHLNLLPDETQPRTFENESEKTWEEIGRRNLTPIR